MDDERIDFSALDPRLDQPRWEQTVTSLVAQALAERRQRLSISHQSLLWARPALAMAALLSLVVWAAGFWTKGPAASQQAAAQPAALTLANWAANNEIPKSNDLFQTLGGQDGNQ